MTYRESLYDWPGRLAEVPVLDALLRAASLSAVLIGVRRGG